MKKEKNVKKVKKVEKTKKSKKNNYFVNLFKELKLVSWPTFNNVLKYTIATVVLILFVTGLFLVLNLGLSVIKEMFA